MGRPECLYHGGYYRERDHMNSGFSGTKYTVCNVGVFMEASIRSGLAVFEMMIMTHRMNLLACIEAGVSMYVNVL